MAAPFSIRLISELSETATRRSPRQSTTSHRLLASTSQEVVVQGFAVSDRKRGFANARVHVPVLRRAREVPRPYLDCTVRRSRVNVLAIAVPAYSVQTLRVSVLSVQRAQILPRLHVANQNRMETLPSNTLIVLSPLTETKKAPSGEYLCVIQPPRPDRTACTKFL